MGCDPVSGALLRGMEIDVEPNSGSSPSSLSFGLGINLFNKSVGPGIEINGISGGVWANGVLVNGISGSGTCFGAQSGVNSASGLDLSQGPYNSGAAIVLAGNQSIRWAGNVNMFADSGGNLEIGAANAIIMGGPSSSEGLLIAIIRDSSAISTASFFVAYGSAPNEAACAASVNGQSSTGRSINAGGSVNSYGMDYAEYEKKTSGCGTIKRGPLSGTTRTDI